MKNQNIDPIWEEEIYGKGMHLNRYPFDVVVSFIFRWHPRNKSRSDIKILEVGCGAANNLWFAAREGFNVSGIDSSPTAIASARKRFEQEKLSCDLQIGSFENLPWEDQSFDLVIVIDRQALVCVSHSVQKEALNEVHRVMRQKALFLSNRYSDRHTSAFSGTRLPDGRTTDIFAGTLTGVGNITFSSRQEVTALFDVGWKIEKLEHVDVDDYSTSTMTRHSEWNVIARKI